MLLLCCFFYFFFFISGFFILFFSIQQIKPIIKNARVSRNTRLKKIIEFKAGVQQKTKNKKNCFCYTKLESWTIRINNEFAEMISRELKYTDEILKYFLQESHPMWGEEYKILFSTQLYKQKFILFIEQCACDNGIIISCKYQKEEKKKKSGVLVLRENQLPSVSENVYYNFPMTSRINISKNQSLIKIIRE